MGQDRHFRATAAALLLALGSVLTGASAASADATITPQNVDFGTQAQGTSSEPRIIELRNTGRNPLSVARAEVNSGPENRHFVIGKDECTGATLEPQGQCRVELEFKPLSTGSISQTFGFDVSGRDYPTIEERAAVTTLTGVGTGAPVPPGSKGPAPVASPTPFGLLIPIVGVSAIGVGFLVLASVRRPDSRSI